MLSKPIFAYAHLGNTVFGFVLGFCKKSIFGTVVFSWHLWSEYPVYDAYSFLSERIPLLGIQTRGNWQRQIIFQRYKGGVKVRKYSVYAGMAKSHLVPYQPKFAAGQAAWKTLSFSTQRRLTSRASKLGLQTTGRNYFMSLWLKDHHELNQYWPENP